MQNKTFHLGHRPELDGLRGIAILLVFLHHAGITFIHGAHIGVDIFFVLSGFLITALLCQEYERYGQINLKNFYVRRLLRLTPAFALLLCVLGSYALISKTGTELGKTGKAIVYSAFYLSDFALAFNFASLGTLEHTWSLAIEEHFYLLYPLALVLLFGKRMSRTAIFSLLCSLIIVISIHRTLLWEPTTQGINRVFYGFDTRADGLLIGCLLGLIASWGKLPSVKRFAAAVCASVLFLAVVFVAWDSAIYAYGLPVINLCTAIVLAFVLNSRPAWLSNKTLVWVGVISYGLYLWHNPIFVLIRERITESPWGVLVLGSIVSFACAALSYYILEKPCLKLKKKFTNPSSKNENIDAVVFNTPAPSSLNT